MSALLIAYGKVETWLSDYGWMSESGWMIAVDFSMIFFGGTDEKGDGVTMVVG
jgi:hypothetical protein